MRKPLDPEYIAKLRDSWVNDRKAEMVEDPVYLQTLLYNTDIDYDRLTALMVRLFKARYEKDSLIEAISNFRDFCEENLEYLAEKECDSNPLRFDNSDDYWEEG